MIWVGMVAEERQKKISQKPSRCIQCNSFLDNIEDVLFFAISKGFQVHELGKEDRLVLSIQHQRKKVINY